VQHQICYCPKNLDMRKKVCGAVIENLGYSRYISFIQLLPSDQSSFFVLSLALETTGQTFKYSKHMKLLR
jgi:hypothetical protein